MRPVLALKLAAFLLLAPATGLGATTVTGLAATAASVTVGLDGRVAGVKAFALTAPLRLVVDLAGVAAPRRTIDGDGAAAVTRARIGQFDPATARLVIELSRPMRLADAAVGGEGRLVLTLVPVPQASFDREVARGRHTVAGFAPAAAPPPAPVPQAPPARAEAATASPASPARDDPTTTPTSDFDLPAEALGPLVAPPGPATGAASGASPPVVSPTAAPSSNAPRSIAPPPPTRSPTLSASPSRRKRPLVVIDAGHGGKDVGTISVVDGAYEKNVTLAIACAAAAALERRGLVRVRLTRDGDVFVPLPQRVAIARAARADLFVSVHADSAPNPEARGASVYTLSETASDVVAARLAARENKADIIAGVNLGIDAPDVGDILIDLVQRETMNVAVAFAETLQASLGDRIGWRGEFHHFAGFRVLKAADVPSVLLETGYLSNSDDARLLLSPAGQKRIGDGIARAVEAHFASNHARR